MKTLVRKLLYHPLYRSAKPQKDVCVSLDLIRLSDVNSTFSTTVTVQTVYEILARRIPTYLQILGQALQQQVTLPVTVFTVQNIIVIGYMKNSLLKQHKVDNILYLDQEKSSQVYSNIFNHSFSTFTHSVFL